MVIHDVRYEAKYSKPQITSYKSSFTGKSYQISVRNNYLMKLGERKQSILGKIS